MSPQTIRYLVHKTVGPQAPSAEEPVPELSEGRFEGFQTLMADPDGLVLSPLDRGEGDVLLVVNPHYESAVVSINGVAIGVLGSGAMAQVKELAGGRYGLALGYPDGFQIVQDLETI